MNVRELHEQLTEMMADGYGDDHVVVGNTLAGRLVVLVERRSAFWDGNSRKFHFSDGDYPGCMSRVIRISTSDK
jgi:hypothetical protein